MLYVSNSIYNFLELVLTSLSDLIPDPIYKCLRLFETAVEENLEFFPYNRQSNSALSLLLRMLPVV